MIRLCLLLPLLFAPAAPAARAEGDGPRPLAAWLTQLQTLATKFRKGDTDIQTEAAFKAFTEAVKKEHDGKQIQFTTEVKDVRWSKGIATVTTEAEHTGNPKPTAALPLRYRRVWPIEVKMTEADALAIKKGAQLRFTATLTFHPGAGVSAASLGGQPLYEITHEHLIPSLPAGTFSGSDCAIQIGGRRYESRWVEEKAKGEEK